ncbi:MAG: cation transporter [Ferrovum sp.]|jgi:Cu(I)/Ag(I) efflux system protein CusF|nr:cation transporter [Ferrovum sp.]
MSQLNSLLVALGLSLVFPALADGMNEMPHMQGSAMGNGAEMTSKMAHGIGTVKGVDTKKGTITLAHQPIKELNWPAMTMTFKVAKSELLNGVTVGQHVNFTLQGNDMNPVVTAISITK